MIPRYSRPQATRIWSDGVRFELWLDIELALVEVFEEEGLAPAGTAATIREGTKLNPERILEIEATTKHDVIAFLTHGKASFLDLTEYRLRSWAFVEMLSYISKRNRS